MKYTVFEKFEIDFIKENFEKMKYSEITEILNLTNKIKKTEKQIRNRARYENLTKTNTTINKNFFEEINNEDNAYWLGFIYADGWIATTSRNAEIGIELKKDDWTHLEKFNKVLNGNLPITFKEKNIKIANNKHITHTEICKIRIYSKKMAADLIKNNVTENKTLKEIHPTIEDDNLFWHFVRGFLDGDGCIYFQKEKHVAIKFTGANLEFFQYLQKRFLEFGFCSKIFTTSDRRHDLYLNGDKISFLNKVYNESTIFLERKYELYCKALQFSNELKAVSKIGEG